MNTFTRLIRHLVTTSAVGRRAFPTATLQMVKQQITEGESRHRAEIRLIVEPSLSAGAVLHRITSRARALALFAQYGIWDTEENCGVLIYINIADHKVEIITDRAIWKKIPAEDWQVICTDMTRGFKQGAFIESTLAALSKTNKLLEQHFPATGSRANQIPNQPLVL